MRWNQAGLKIAHFGDLGQEQLTAAQLADLQNLDILFLPAGGFFTDLAGTRGGLCEGVETAGSRFSCTIAPRWAAPRKPPGCRIRPRRSRRSSTSQPPSYVNAAHSARGHRSLGDGTGRRQRGGQRRQFHAGSAGGAGLDRFPLRQVHRIANRRGRQLSPARANSATRKCCWPERPCRSYYVSSGQVNLQVPAGQAAGQVLAEVRVGGQVSGAQSGHGDSQRPRHLRRRQPGWARQHGEPSGAPG